MILCGIPLGESFLKARLSVLMRTELKSLKEGKLPMNDSYYLMGTADPTGILKPYCLDLMYTHCMYSDLQSY
ncbi:hypothetical protein MKW92_009291, partial [Papaver armeniacum]